MNNPIESLMYDASQFFLYPVLLAIAVLFLHSFYALGSSPGRRDSAGAASGVASNCSRWHANSRNFRWRRSRRWP